MGQRIFHLFFASAPMIFMAAVYFLMLRLMDSWMLLPALFLVGLAFFGLQWVHKRMTGFELERKEQIGLYLLMALSGYFFYSAAHAEIHWLRYFNPAAVIEGSLTLAASKVMLVSFALFALLFPRIFLQRDKWDSFAQ